MAAKRRMLVLGAGTWGCTLAALLSEKGYDITIWDISEGVLDILERTRVPFRLPSLTLPRDVGIEHKLTEALAGAEILVIVVPSHSVRPLCENLLDADPNISSRKFVLCSKGIERGTLLTMSGVMEDVLGSKVRERFCCLSGPSHAEEVSKKMPTTVVASAYRAEVAGEVQEIFHTRFFRIYTQQDVLGVELGAAVKNVIAIAAGVCDGLGFGDNTKAALLTRGLAEIMRLGVAMGARRETFSGLAGVGDLMVTAMSRHSRNRNFGELLAKGCSVEEAMGEIGMVVEGVKTADSVRALSEKYSVQMPISREVYRLIYEGKKPHDAVQDLLKRSPKPEIYGPDKV